MYPAVSTWLATPLVFLCVYVKLDKKRVETYFPLIHSRKNKKRANLRAKIVVIYPFERTLAEIGCFRVFNANAVGHYHHHNYSWIVQQILSSLKRCVTFSQLHEILAAQQNTFMIVKKIFAWGKLMSHRYRSLGKKEDANTKRTFRKRTMK